MWHFLCEIGIPDCFKRRLIASATFAYTAFRRKATVVTKVAINIGNKEPINKLSGYRRYDT